MITCTTGNPISGSVRSTTMKSFPSVSQMSRAWIDGRDDHAVAKHGDVRAPLENLVRGVDDRFLDVVSRRLAVRATDESHVFQRHLQRPLLDQRVAVHPMKRIVECADAIEDRRRRSGDVAEQGCDRQRVRHLVLACAEVAGQFTGRACGEPFRALGERAGGAARGRDAFAHGAEVECLR